MPTRVAALTRSSPNSFAIHATGKRPSGEPPAVPPLRQQVPDRRQGGRGKGARTTELQRRYGLDHTLAHRYSSQFPQRLQDEIFSHLASTAPFGLGAKNAQVTQKEFLALPGFPWVT